MHMETRIYSLFLHKSTKILLFALLGVYTFCGLLVPITPFFILAFDDFPTIPMLGLIVLELIVFGAIIVIWYKVLTIPYQIHIITDHEIEFVSLLKRKRVLSEDIFSIIPGRSFGFLIFTFCDGKKLRLPLQFNDFHEFLLWLKKKNASIILKGC